jgi:glycosyltransferase involved in cell wall biosynthesis
MKERLAIFTSTMAGGGAQRVMLNLAGGFADRGYAVDLVVKRAQGHYVEDVPGAVRLVDLRVRRMVASTAPLISYLRRERPTAMLSAMHYVNIVALCARRIASVNMTLVISEHNTLSLAVRHASRRRARLRPWLIRRFYPWADGMVAVSRGVAEDLASATGLPRERIDVIYNPVVTPEMKTMAEAPLDHPWFAPRQPPVVLGAGRFTAQKDFGSLIGAFAKLRERRAARLLILGEGPDHADLMSLIARLELEQEVLLPGFVANPYAFMARAGAFVLSSRWEGLPTVLIEALFCGAPVIATDCPSGPREILDNGRHGQLVPVGDEDALARAMELALDGRVPRPGRESWQPFEREVVVNRYLESLLGR